jgi:hypothetical protein
VARAGRAAYRKAVVAAARRLKSDVVDRPTRHVLQVELAPPAAHSPTSPHVHGLLTSSSMRKSGLRVGAEPLDQPG